MTQTYDKTVEFLLSNNYIANSKFCLEYDNKEMKIVKNDSLKSWQCSRCTKKISLLQSTILNNWNKTLNEIINIICFWSIDLTQNKTMIEDNKCSINTINKWCIKLSI
ncbi:hypothetical protein H312_02461 [Anncaliia algerae PRA339]|uniref:Uncharacterized protein n=1 Tax=Anncaliia algerae PRA339 TaxID=1288291 RepID=A0A059EZH4_9MICR|nr:hypothetical protein H312_02461 [Anncaliia algerae PRA339]